MMECLSQKAPGQPSPFRRWRNALFMKPGGTASRSPADAQTFLEASGVPVADQGITIAAPAELPLRLMQDLSQHRFPAERRC
jgi:hypothetical protein